jgi:hypothetical protein
VAGSIDEVCGAGADLGGAGQVTKGVEMLVLTETGYKASLAAEIDAWAKRDGWQKVACSVRPYDAAHGGVAVFVKRPSGKEVPRVRSVDAELVRDTPALGTAWCRIRVEGGEWVYVCACYVPHDSSRYYQREGKGGGVCKNRHWEALAAGIQEFSVQGHVVLVGDFNCRIGNSQVGSDLMKGTRRSRDQTWNAATGGRLVRMCEEQGLVILNGRVPGDEAGSYTFYARGVDRGQSVIDYAIASPKLVCQADGAVRKGTRLEVWPAKQAVTRLDGRLYDHQPVTLVVRLARKDGGRQRTKKAGQESRQEVSKSLRWHDSMREEYVGVLLTDSDVQQKLREVRMGPGVDEAAVSFEEAIWLAAQRVDDVVGQENRVRMVVRRGGRERKRGERPRNGWYDEECAKARRACKEAEGHEAQLAARREYKRITKRACRRWETAEAERRRALLRENARSFWSEYKGHQARPAIGMDEWSDYFEQLFQAGEEQEAQEPELCDRMLQLEMSPTRRQQGLG